MPYKISGSLSRPTEVTVLDSNGIFQTKQSFPAGEYEINNLMVSNGIVLGVTDDEQYRSYGNVDFIKYEETTIWDNSEWENNWLGYPFLSRATAQQYDYLFTGLWFYEDEYWPSPVIRTNNSYWTSNSGVSWDSTRNAWLLSGDGDLIVNGTWAQGFRPDYMIIEVSKVPGYDVSGWQIVVDSLNGDGLFASVYPRHKIGGFGAVWADEWPNYNEFYGSLQWSYNDNDIVRIHFRRTSSGGRAYIKNIKFVTFDPTKWVNRFGPTHWNETSWQINWQTGSSDYKIEWENQFGNNTTVVYFSGPNGWSTEGYKPLGFKSTFKRSQSGGLYEELACTLWGSINEGLGPGSSTAYETLKGGATHQRVGENNFSMTGVNHGFFTRTCPGGSINLW
jgi:hypothetical protein